MPMMLPEIFLKWAHFFSRILRFSGGIRQSGCGILKALSTYLRIGHQLPFLTHDPSRYKLDFAYIPNQLLGRYNGRSSSHPISIPFPSRWIPKATKYRTAEFTRDLLVLGKLVNIHEHDRYGGISNMIDTWEFRVVLCQI